MTSKTGPKISLGTRYCQKVQSTRGTGTETGIASSLVHEGILSCDVVDYCWRHILAVNVNLATTYDVALGAFQEALDTDGVLSCHDARERVRVLRSVRVELRVPSVPER